MKKILSKLIIGVWIVTLFLGLGQNSLAEDKLATLILPETGTKQIVQVDSQEAKHFFRLGYHLMTNLLGATFTPTTAYSERLSISAASNATTIYVSSVLDRDGLVLPLSATNKGYFTLEPGTSREESIVCTSASSTTNTLSGCTRGLAASGSDETGSSARAYSHNAGSKIIMTNIAQFFGNFVDITNNQTIGGNKTFTGSTNFTSLPTTSTSTPTLDEQLATKRYVDQFVISGGVVGTETTPGIWEGATQEEMASGIGTSTYSGTNYNLLLQSKYSNATSSATTTIPVTKSNGKLNQGFLDLTEDWTFSGNVLIDKYDINIFGNGDDGDVVISTTTTLTSDIHYNNLTIASGTELISGGYRIYVKDTLTIEGTGKISVNGNNGGNGQTATSSSVAQGGIAAIATYISSTLPLAALSTKGAYGVVTVGNTKAAGINASSTVSLISVINNVNGSIGGNGGGVEGTYHYGSGSAGGVLSYYTYKSFKTVYDTYNLIDLSQGSIKLLNASQPSGSGGSGASLPESGITCSTGAGGASGGGGGFVVIYAKSLVLSTESYFEAKGGNGGNGGNAWLSSGTAGSCGGGGGGAGGSGGVIILVYNMKTGTINYNVSGGSGGSGGLKASGLDTYNGKNGESGKTGTFIEIDL